MRLNAVLARLDLGYFEWPLIIPPGSVPREIGIALACGPSGTFEFEQQRSQLCNSALRGANPTWL